MDNLFVRVLSTILSVATETTSIRLSRGAICNVPQYGCTIVSTFTDLTYVLQSEQESFSCNFDEVFRTDTMLSDIQRLIAQRYELEKNTTLIETYYRYDHTISDVSIFRGSYELMYV